MAENENDELPQRNPFRSKTWNLTAQMQLLRDDPKKARRLKAEAEVDGEAAGPKPKKNRWC